MYHPIDSRFLYCALKLVLIFRDEYQKMHTVSGTGFLVGSSANDRKPVLFTNRHVIDAGFSDPRKREWNVEKITVSGYGNSKEFFEFELFEFEYRFPKNVIEDVVGVSFQSVFFSKKDDQFSGAVNFDFDVVADQEYFESLNVGDFLVLPGYPEFHDKNTNRPILRSGIISRVRTC